LLEFPQGVHVMNIEEKVAGHYSHAGLEQKIIDALKAAGRNTDRLSTADLAGIDEFHMGWHPATVELAKNLGFGKDMKLLDIGSGIGGPARYFAEALGCRVTGIDLTDDFVQAANGLTARCGLADRASFRQASALALPFAAESFDRATLIHVGMNIADKAKLFSEARRVLRKGSLFGVYDVMRTGESALPFPMPWSSGPETSFVETPETYRRLLAAAGFAIESEISRRDFVLKLAGEMREEIARNGPPAIGLHILMGAAAKERLGNVMATLERGTIAPIEIVARAM
jgi:ubiquinone/menaquinone biosynthesis C-methylase UbiE